MGESDRPVVSVVDDDESLRRSLRNLLRSVGFGVETFASAEEFLRSGQRANTGCPFIRLVNQMAEADVKSLESILDAELSALVHMSPYHFARLFKRSTGVPPHRFLVCRRIDAGSPG